MNIVRLEPWSYPPPPPNPRPIPIWSWQTCRRFASHREDDPETNTKILNMLNYSKSRSRSVWWVITVLVLVNETNHGSHFFPVTKFPDFSSIFSIFPWPFFDYFLRFEFNIHEYFISWMILINEPVFPDSLDILTFPWLLFFFKFPHFSLTGKICPIFQGFWSTNDTDINYVPGHRPSTAGRTDPPGPASHL